MVSPQPVQADADLAAEAADRGTAGADAVGLIQVVGQFLMGPVGPVQAVCGRPVDDPAADRLGQATGNGRRPALGLAASQPVGAALEVGVEPALDAARRDGQVPGDVPVGPTAVGQADDLNAVARLEVGFVAEKEVEPPGFLRRQTDAYHFLCCSFDGMKMSSSLYATDSLSERVYKSFPGVGGKDFRLANGESEETSGIATKVAAPLVSVRGLSGSSPSTLRPPLLGRNGGQQATER